MDLRFKEVYRIEKDFKKVPKPLKMLSFAFLLYTLSWGTIVPYLSLYIHSIVPSYSEVGFLISLMSIVAAVISVLIGDLIDKVGRKNVLIFSFVNYIIIGPLYALANSIGALMVARIYHGIAVVGIWIPSQTYVRDISPKKKRAEYMGYFYTASSLSYTVGPLIGALVVTFFDIRYMFYVVGLVALVAAMIVNRLPESIKVRETMYQGIKDVLFKDKFIGKELKDYDDEKTLGIKITLIAFFTKMSSAILIMILALYIHNLGGSLWQIGVVYSLLYFPFTFQFAFGEIADHVGARKTLIFGASLTSVFFCALFMSNNIMSILLFAFLSGVGLAIISPVLSSYVSAMAKRKKGEITGIYGAIADIAAFVGPVVGGLLADMYGLNSAFLFGAIVMLAVIFVGLRVE